MTQGSHPYGEIYVVTCLVNGKQYVGQTTQGVAVRWGAHKRGSGRVSGLRSAIAKYGVDSFIVEAVDHASDQTELDAKEVCWITTMGSLSPNGYNLMGGGKSGGIPSEETRRRMSEAKVGRKASPETRAKMSATRSTPESKERLRAARLGTQASPETRAKLSASRKGKKRPPEVCAAISLSLTGRAKSPEHREKNRLGHVGIQPSSETLTKRSVALRASWARRKSLGIGLKQDPSVVEKRRTAMLEYWKSTKQG